MSLETSHRDLFTLQAEIAAWLTDVNNTQSGVDWDMNLDDARYKLKSVYPEIKLWRTTSGRFKTGTTDIQTVAAT